MGETGNIGQGAGDGSADPGGMDNLQGQSLPAIFRLAHAKIAVVFAPLKSSPNEHAWYALSNVGSESSLTLYGEREMLLFLAPAAAVLPSLA